MAGRQAEERDLYERAVEGWSARACFTAAAGRRGGPLHDPGGRTAPGRPRCRRPHCVPLPPRRRRAERTRAPRLGLPSPWSRRPTRTCSRARSTSGRASTVTGSGSNSPRSTRSRPRPGAGEEVALDPRSGRVDAERLRGRAEVHPLRRLAVSGQRARGDRPGRPDSRSCGGNRPGVGLERLKDQAGLVEAFSVVSSS